MFGLMQSPSPKNVKKGLHVLEFWMLVQTLNPSDAKTLTFESPQPQNPKTLNPSDRKLTQLV